MKYSMPFKFARSFLGAALLGVIALVSPLTAHSMIAGKAAFVMGKVEAITVDGTRRALTKGSEISSGDTISTEMGARAQIRFNDGGYISLQPNSLFRVDEFNYQNKTDGEEKGFFSLLKGGLRAITGAIGRVNRDSYRVATPVATIGVRGTGYSAELSDGLLVNVGEGAISLTNNAGLLLVSSGNAAYVATINTLPVFTTRQPKNPPARFYPMRPLRQNIATTTSDGPVESMVPVQFTAVERRNPDGSLIIAPDIVANPNPGPNPPPTLPPQPTYDMAYAYMDCGNTCAATLGGASDMVPTFNTGQLIGYVSPTVIGAVGTGLVSSAGTDNIISWGRWTGRGIAPVPPLALPSVNLGTFDYVVGVPTAVMPTVGTFTYSLIGNTPPSATNGSLWTLASGSLTANFTTSTVAVNLTVSNSTSSYMITAAPVPITNATFNSGMASLPVTGSSLGLCTQSCSASINGFFSGTDAARAGLAYAIRDSGPITAFLPTTVQGVAAFTKGAPALAF